VKKYLLELLQKYQKNISPYFKKNGYHCVFQQTCSQYAVETLKKNNIVTAIIFITIRLFSCNPINAYLHIRRKEVQYG